MLKVRIRLTDILDVRIETKVCLGGGGEQDEELAE